MADVTRRRFLETSSAAIAAATALTVAESDAAEPGDQPAEQCATHQADNFVSKNEKGFASDAIHAGEDTDNAATPIYYGNSNGGDYAREGTPTTWAFEQKAATLDSGEAAMCTSCGMAAVTQTLLTLLSAGDRVVRHRCVYLGTMRFMWKDLPRFGITADTVDMRQLDALKKTLQEKKTKIVYFEPHANPTVEVLPVKEICELARAHGATVVVDNTFLSPYLLQPLRLGADLVLHSATKYIGGHGDCMAGVVVGDKKRIDQLKETRNRLGGILSPQCATLLLRGLKTLPIRMEAHCRNAMQLATFLESHPKVRTVRYPGLPSHPDHKTAARQVRGFGGMMGIVLEGGFAAGAKFGESLSYCKNWTSLGDVKTLVQEPAGRDAGAGLADGYVRISVGIEAIEDVLSDFAQALDRV